ncbi:MAG: ArdC family protein [Acidobacteriota bacterium]
MRRQPTPEQKERAAARRAAFREIVKTVAALDAAGRLEMVARIGSIPTCEGRALSLFNTCLILTQLPTASMVGGFRQWQKAGRQVKKGEHGMSIWIPTGAKDEPDASDEEKPTFLMGTVFDISQTEPMDE